MRAAVPRRPGETCGVPFRGNLAVRG